MMRTVWVILVVAAALRLALLACAWSDISRAKTPDSDRYITLAQNLAQSGRFEADARPEIFRTPGYPMFLRLFVPLGEHWWQAALAAQGTLDVLLVYVVLLLGRALGGNRIGLLAAALQALSPLAIANSVRLLSDSLFALLLMLAILLLVLHVQRRTWATIIGCALAMSIACYVRPVGLVYLGIVVIFMLGLGVVAIKRGTALDIAEGAVATAVCRHVHPSVQASMVGKSVRHGFRSFSQLKRAAVLIVICGAALGPWVARNLFQAGYAGFSSFASDSVYFFAAPEIVARTEGISAEAARQRFQQADAEFARSHPHATPGDMVRFRSDSSGRVIHEHPLLYARLHLAGAAGYFLPGATEVLEVAGMTHGQQGTLDVLHKNGVVAAIRHYFGGNYAAMALAAPIAAFELAVFVGAVMLAVRRLVSRKKVRPYLFVLWLLVTMVIISPLLSGPFGLPRYRLPMTPLWILAAAAGWLGLQKRRAADDAKKAGS